MAQFEIIKDVSVSLTKLLTEAFKEAGYKDIEVYNTLPTEENVKKLPAICLFMTAVSIDRQHRERDVVLVSETTEEGDVVEYERQPTMVVWLYYLLSSWGKTPQEEHVLLGLAMRVLHDHPLLAEELFQGDSLARGEELPIRVVDEAEFGYDENMAFWRSLGEPIRPAVLYRVGARLRSTRALRHIKRVTSRNITFKR
jgi:hypothetical protein